MQKACHYNILSTDCYTKEHENKFIQAYLSRTHDPQPERDTFKLIKRNPTERQEKSSITFLAETKGKETDLPCRKPLEPHLCT